VGCRIQVKFEEAARLRDLISDIKGGKLPVEQYIIIKSKTA